MCVPWVIITYPSKAYDVHQADMALAVYSALAYVTFSVFIE